MLNKYIWHAVTLLYFFLPIFSESQATEKSVVFIECTSKDAQLTTKGSGVLVSPNGHVLTARHVAPAGFDCKGVVGTAGQTPVRKLLRDPRIVAIDATMLRFVPEPEEHFEFLSYRKIEGPLLKGKAISAYGFPNKGTGEVVSNTGTLSSTVPDENGIIATDALSTSGMSGGPVVLIDDGSLIGIVAGADFDLSTGSPSSYGVLAAQLVASSFELTEKHATEGTFTTTNPTTNEKNYGPISLEPGEVHKIPFSMENGGPVDFYLQKIEYEGANHGSSAVHVTICPAEEEKLCRSRQMGDSETLRQRLPSGPGHVSIFNFKENPTVILTFRIVKPI